MQAALHCHTQSVTSRKDYALIITNAYLCTYYWDDPLTKEPMEPPPPPHLKALTLQRKAQKAAKIAQITASIYNWLDYQWKHPKSGLDPIPTNQSRYRTFPSAHSSQTLGRAQVGAAAAYMCTQFAALPAEEREKYEALAKEEGRLAHEEKLCAIANAGELLSPSEAQCTIDHLPSTLGLFLKKLGSVLGFHACLYLAGPEPRKEFPKAMPGHYATSARLFEQFVKTCYSDNNKLAKSLPPEELATYPTLACVPIEEVVDLQETSPQAKQVCDEVEDTEGDEHPQKKKKNAGKKKSGK
ncbi:hypothetical protein EDD18DRAFT_1344614 [Armillaria luteobubalina]|uniref:Uncharacterized protein n=1 Tax=Armillaria luteobubalina TaxID=153913 RepID=A0AA39QIV5_9AGAR|nr:hypothetical protein EDD18DRAFT_1344614 [Armillaria luteobubalina]